MPYPPHDPEWLYQMLTSAFYYTVRQCDDILDKDPRSDVSHIYDWIGPCWVNEPRQISCPQFVCSPSSCQRILIRWTSSTELATGWYNEIFAFLAEVSPNPKTTATVARSARAQHCRWMTGATRFESGSPQPRMAKSTWTTGGRGGARARPSQSSAGRTRERCALGACGCDHGYPRQSGAPQKCYSPLPVATPTGCLPRQA